MSDRLAPSNLKVASNPSVSFVLDYILAQVPNDQRPYVNVSILGQNILGLLDSGASHTIVGRNGWKFLCDLGLNSLNSSVRRSVAVANGQSCESIGTVQVPFRLKDRERLIEVLVIPELPHSIILGIDFWTKMGIVPDFRDWTFSFCEPVKLMEALTPRSSLTSEQEKKLNSILEVNFKAMGTGLGCTDLYEHEIVTDSPPIKQRYYPVSPAVQKYIDAEIKDMLEKDIIEPSNSPWSSPVVMIRKRDNTFRFCVDYRKLNKVTRRDAYPLPPVNSILDKLRDARYLSTLDIKSAFHQIKVAEESRPLTAFSVYKGHYQFKRLPFGLSNSPATWERLIDRVLGSDLEPYVFCYLDDIVVISQTFEKHLEVLSEVLSRLTRAGLTLSRDKCFFCKEELRYLGYVVNGNGLQVDPEKINAILQVPTPTKVQEVRSIIGTASWYRRFVPGFSSLIAPLTELLRKNAKFCWTSRQEEALTAIKERLVSAPILSCPNFELPFVIQTDASGYGLGAVLTQNYPDGTEKVVCYLSRSLTKMERKYSTTERECLAVLWAIEKLRPYIEATHFTVVTDHWSLKWLNNLREPTGRLSRWALKLQSYDFDIVHRKGAEHHLPDMLSRSVPLVDSVEVHSPVTYAGNDRWYASMLKSVESKPRNFSKWNIHNGLLYKFVENKYHTFGSTSDNWKRVIPKEERHEILVRCHDEPTAGHPGVSRTYARLCEKYYWPKMKADVVRYVRSCIVCGRVKPEQRARPGLMVPNRIVETPWELVACDLMGPFPRSNLGHRFILVIVDCFTKFPILVPLRNATAKLVCAAIENSLLLFFGSPRFIITDNGVQFKSREFRNLMSSYGVKVRHTANFHCQSNPSERVNRNVNTMLRCYVSDNHKLWDRHLHKIAFALRTQVHEATKHTPYYLNFGREARTIDKLAESVDPPDSHELLVRDSDIRDRRHDYQKLYEEVKSRLVKAASKYKSHYDLRRRDLQFEPGDRVWRRNFTLSSAPDSYAAKLGPRFLGPFVISRRFSPWTYELTDLQGTNRGVWHTKDLKPASADSSWV